MYGNCAGLTGDTASLGDPILIKLVRAKHAWHLALPA
jgi:hypothetical protein